MNTIIPRTSSSAVVSLVFGIVAWLVLPVIGAVVAVVTGHIARSEIRRAPPGTVEGDGLAVAGLLLGYIQLILCLLALVAIFLFFGGLLFFANMVG